MTKQQTFSPVFVIEERWAGVVSYRPFNDYHYLLKYVVPEHSDKVFITEFRELQSLEQWIDRFSSEIDLYQLPDMLRGQSDV